MIRSATYALALAFAMPAAAFAAPSFTGTWKVDPSSQKLPTTPDQYSLVKGIYQCSTCEIKAKIPADGNDHPVAGSPYFDTESVAVVGTSTVQITRKKAGKAVLWITARVGPDGKTLEISVTDSTASSGASGTAKMTETRVGNPVPGAHPITGSWVQKDFSASDNFMTVTFKQDGKTLAMSTPTGMSYSAKLNGKDVPYMGDPGTTSVSLRKIGADTIEETDKRNGKVIQIIKMTLSKDGNTLTSVVDDKIHNQQMSYAATRQ